MRIKRTGWPISRVLYLRSVTGPEAAIIHLGTPLPTPSSGLPEHLGRAALKRVLYGLAPGGVYLAVPVTRNAGGLLHHLFTLTERHCSPRGGTYPTAVSFLWHWPAGFPEWALPTTLLCGARTFLGGSFKGNQRDRLANPSSLNATACAPFPGSASSGVSSGRAKEGAGGEDAGGRRGGGRGSRRIIWC